MIPVTIYSRPGCHLCEEMKALVSRVGTAIPLAVEVVDVSSDPVLENRYGEEVPVLIVGGVKAAKYRVSEDVLVRVLRAITDRPAAAERSAGRGGSGRPEPES